MNIVNKPSLLFVCIIANYFKKYILLIFVFRFIYLYIIYTLESIKILLKRKYINFKIKKK